MYKNDLKRAGIEWIVSSLVSALKASIRSTGRLGKQYLLLFSCPGRKKEKKIGQKKKSRQKRQKIKTKKRNQDKKIKTKKTQKKKSRQKKKEKRQKYNKGQKGKDQKESLIS